MHDPLHIFFSYTKQDAFLAGEYKRNLEEMFGFSVFVAHDDIETGEEWSKSIINSLDNTDLLIPILTQTFHTSCYANQEVGFALGAKLAILPLKITQNPLGFINKYQALSHKHNVQSTSRKLCGILIKNAAYIAIRPKILNSLIHCLRHSYSYARTRELVPFLLEFEEYTIDHLNALQDAFTNKQVSGELYKVPVLQKMIEDRYDVII